MAKILRYRGTYLVGGIGYIASPGSEWHLGLDAARADVLTISPQLIPAHHKFVVCNDGSILPVDESVSSAATWNVHDRMLDAYS